MKILIYFGLLVVVGIGLTTCTYNNEEVLYGGSTNSCDTTNITFTAKVAPIFINNCVRCHGNIVAAQSGGGIKLENYEDIKANINRAYGAMNHDPLIQPMPRDMSAKIDACDIKKVRIWKDAGALKN